MRPASCRSVGGAAPFSSSLANKSRKKRSLSASRIYREALLLQLAEAESWNVFRPLGRWSDLPGCTLSFTAASLFLTELVRC